MAHSERLAADQAQKPGPGQTSRTEPSDHQRHTLAAAVWCAVARRAVKIREVEHCLSPVPAVERGRAWEIVAVTLAEIMADTGHYSIDSTTVRAHESAAGGKGGGAHRRALGRSRSGFTRKLHFLADALGRPLAFHLTGGGGRLQGL